MITGPGEIGGEAIEEMPVDGGEEVAAETVQIPTSILGGQKVNPGDRISLEVVDFDDENGVLNVKYAMPKKKESMGVDAMAAEFD